MAEPAPFRITRAAASAGLADATERLLGMLPAWFGIPEANAGYVRSATELDGFVATTATGTVGVVLCRRHFPSTAEIHLIAVDPAWHRRGVGRALVAAVESEVIGDGGRLLEVKTLGPSHPDEGYAKTRAFYRSVGFLPLEEFHDLWPGNPALILVKPLHRR
ncbi:MAG TPA: GNAT family N-acetyltransferase [Pseudonocardiaceae bacterium]|nr:GNAT family N-acetyltransferase [Pseudonocardiaceae bacterium]